MKGRGETLPINEMESLLRLELTCIGSQPTKRPTNQPCKHLPSNLIRNQPNIHQPTFRMGNRSTNPTANAKTSQMDNLNQTTD